VIRLMAIPYPSPLFDVSLYEKVTHRNGSERQSEHDRNGETVNTGFEGYILAIVAGMFLWRALRRLNVTIHNTNSPTASASANSESKPAAPSRSFVGLVAMGLIALAVAVAVITQLAAHVEQPQVIPQAAPISVPIEARPQPAPIVTESPVELPAVPMVDFAPLFALVGIAGVVLVPLWLLSRPHKAGGQRRPVQTIRRLESKLQGGLTHELFNQALKQHEEQKRK